MPVHDVTSHATLSEEADRLASNASDAFDAVVSAAESMLSLDEDFGDDDEVAKLAIVHQVNYMVNHTPNATQLSSKSQAARSWSFRDAVLTLDPMAEALAEELLPSDEEVDAYAVLNSLR
jgi:hypothetical protein